MDDKRYSDYWRENVRLIWILLLIWAFVSFVCGIILVKPLNTITVGSVPLGFWIAQQGSIWVFVILTFFYAWRMDRIDHKYKLDVDEDQDGTTDQ
jgi:putative solute:sodium symporter small subunit